MEKIKQNTNCRRWASLWLVIAMAVMTAIFLRGGVVVQAEENEMPLSVRSVYVVNGDEYENYTNMPNLFVGSEIILKVKAEGGKGDYSYQWYKTGKDSEIIPDAIEKTLTISKQEQKMEYYYCIVTDGQGTSQWAYFYIPAEHTLTVTQYVNDEELSNVEIGENESVSMRVVAESSVDNPQYTYGWYNNKTGGVGCDEATYTITKSDENEVYFCDVSDGVSRERVYFYINLKGTVTINKRTYIINAQSYDAQENLLPELSKDDEITLQVDAESSIGDVNYQWYHLEKSDTEDYETFKKINGATENSLTIKKKKLGREQYYCEISDKKGSKNAEFDIPSVKTLTITQSINDEEDTGSYTTTKGASVTMKVNATSVLGDEKISYQWYGPDNELLEGQTGPTCTVEKGIGYESYYCWVSDTVNEKGCGFSLDTENTISSVKTYINDREEYSISDVNPGKKYTLKVEPVSKNKDATYSYSWYTYNEDREREDVGEDSPELEVTKTKAATDFYYVDITSDDGSRSNGSFCLYRKPVISILAYINGEYAAAGDGNYSYCYVDSSKDLELQVDAKSTADGDITYQWSKGAENDGETEKIDGETEAKYTVAAFEEERESYTCTVTCDGYSMDYGFYLISKDSSSARPDPDIERYILVNGVKADSADDGEIYVDKGSEVTLGINVSDLPEDIKKEDIEYEWYEGDVFEDEEPVYKGQEYTISSVSENKDYYCRLMVNGEPLVDWNVGFYIHINPDVTTEITVNGEKLDADGSSVGVKSFEELYDKDIIIKATDRTNPNAKFTYEWFKSNGEDEDGQSISKTNKCRLTKEILSGYDVNLYCIITDENGNTQQADLNLYVYDNADEGDKYINGQKVYDDDEEQYQAGAKVTLKVAFSEDIANKVKYQWYDSDWKKMDFKKAECTIQKGEGEESYTCIVTDQYNRTSSYDFILYPDTKLVVKRYVNDKKINNSYCPIGAVETVKLEVKATPSDNVSYQWYSGSYSNTKEMEGETKSILHVKVPENSVNEDDYKCLITRGNERKWAYFWVVSCDHSEVEVLPAVPATCEKDGLTEGKRCKECGETIVEQEVVKATGHKWDNGIITKPATATETGVKTFTCTVCKKTKTEVIQKLTTNNTVNNDTTKKPETIETSLKTGTKVTDKKSKAVYKVTGDNTVQYTKASGKKVRKAKKVAIPAAVTVNGVKYQVTAIAPNAFKNNKNLKTIIIPATVRSIGKQAFAGCKNLKSIIIRTPYLTKKSVGAKAFKGISSKAVIKVPKKQLKAYKKLLKTKGVAKSVKIK